jgi:hypothetical protein
VGLSRLITHYSHSLVLRLFENAISTAGLIWCKMGQEDQNLKEVLTNSLTLISESRKAYMNWVSLEYKS